MIDFGLIEDQYIVVVAARNGKSSCAGVLPNFERARDAARDIVAAGAAWAGVLRASSCYEARWVGTEPDVMTEKQWEVGQ